MAASYDTNNVFAKILRGDVPCRRVYEDDVALAFYDIDPQAPVHVLVIPKGDYRSFSDFSTKAQPQDVASFFKAVGFIAKELGLEEGGYRIIANHGDDAGQEVPHFHVHIVGGHPLGMMLK